VIVIQNAKLATLSKYIGRRLGLLFALDVAVAGAYVFAGWKWLALPDVPLSIFGGVIGVLAGFRNASSYARWWEARIIWGAIVNSSRSFAREVLTMIQGSEAYDMKRKLVLLQIAYVHSLRNHLRGTAPWVELKGLISEPEIECLKVEKNVPLAIQEKMASMLAQCYHKGWIDTMRWVSLDRTLTSLMDSQGASERIKNTPMPRMYDFFIRLFIATFCLLLPFGMVASLGLWTPFGSTLVGFVFMALDKIGRDLEAPFDNVLHDIPLTAISRTIEINLKQMIGEREVPEPVCPVNGVLW
jgi:putative membrane protein